MTYWLALVTVAASTAVVAVVPAVKAQESPQLDANGFGLVPEITGLVMPTAVRFTSDGKVFITELAGALRVYDGLNDIVGHKVLDLGLEVHRKADRGLTGLEVHPDWPEVPWVWLLYSADRHGGTAPRWGGPDPASYLGEDFCGQTETQRLTNECVGTAALLRLVLDPITYQVRERHTLIADQWCQPFANHSVGSVVYGSDGALYVGAGDGSSGAERATTIPDYGQKETAGANICRDPQPKNGAGAVDIVRSEGGSLRSQDIRTMADDLGFSGAILRLDPATGAALPTNPLSGGSFASDDRHIGFGFRNPFRFTERPGARQLWIADAGWRTVEEVDVLPMSSSRYPSKPGSTSAAQQTSAVRNFGWPCFEGGVRTQALATNQLCAGLTVGQNAIPAYSYRTGRPPVCPEEDPDPLRFSSISAVQFYDGNGSYPSEYAGNLFVGDYGVQCIWALKVSGTGTVSTTSARLVAAGTRVVDLQPGADGDLFAVDVERGALLRLDHGSPEVGCPEDDAFEPNDSAASARLVSDGDVGPAVLCGNDADWYAFPALAGTPIDVSVFQLDFLQRFNLELWTNGAKIAEAAGTDKGAQLHVEAPASALYQLLVRSRSAGSTTPYYLALSAPCPDDGHNNQTIATAAPSSPPAEGVRCAGETDWYGFDAIGGERLVARFNGGQGDPAFGGTGPLDLAMYDPSLSRLAELSGSGATTVIAARETGRYYGVVTDERPEVLGRYRHEIALRTAAQACAVSPQEGGGDAFEPNDTLPQATQAATWPRMGFLCAADTDLHVVGVKLGDRVRIRLGQHRSSAVDVSDVTLTMTDNSGRQGFVIDEGSSKYVELAALHDGAFVLRISATDPTPRAYLLEKEVVPNCRVDAFEPNDDRESATAIVEGEPYAGTLCSPTGAEDDWFAFTLPAGATATATLQFISQGAEPLFQLEGAGPTNPPTSSAGRMQIQYTAAGPTETVRLLVRGNFSAYELALDIN